MHNVIAIIHIRVKLVVIARVLVWHPLSLYISTVQTMYCNSLYDTSIHSRLAGSSNLQVQYIYKWTSTSSQ